MKWIDPKPGDERIVSGFLWLPKTIGGVTRWLERAEWRQEFRFPNFFSLRADWLDATWSGK
jgi:hypothetical protein